MILTDIVVDLVVSKFLKGHIGPDREGTLPLTSGQADTGDNLMDPSTYHVQHTNRIGLIDRFSQHFIINDNDGVSGNNHVSLTYQMTVGFRFFTCDKLRDVTNRQRVWIVLLYVRKYLHLKVEA